MEWPHSPFELHHEKVLPVPSLAARTGLPVDAASRHTAAYDFKNVFPMWLEGSPAKVDKGMGAMAV